MSKMASSKYVHQFFSLISDGLGGVYVPKLINRWEFDSIIPLGTMIDIDYKPFLKDLYLEIEK